MELVELEFLGHWVVNSKVLLLPKPGAGKSWRIGICWPFKSFAPKSEEFNNSFVAEIS